MLWQGNPLNQLRSRMPATQQHLIDLQFQRLRGKKRPLVALMTAALAILCLSLLSATAWMSWSSWHMHLREAEVTTANMAQALAAQADTALKVADVVLESTVERAEDAGVKGTGLQPHLMRLQAKAAEIHGLFVYDAIGQWIATSLPTPQAGNNADRDYFVFHKTHRQRGTYISAPVRSKSTGVWVIPISRRLDHPDGSFAGVALATLRLDTFERVYDRLNVGETGTIFFALDNGTLIYRRPFQERQIGSDISSGSVLRTYRERGPAGTAMLMAKLDGLERLYSYRHLERFPVVVAAALSKDDIFAPWKAFSLQIAGGALGAIAALVWFFRKLMRQIAIRDQVEAELRVASGELQKANAVLESLASQDALTELANRRHFNDVLDHELKRSQRSDMPVSLILLDVDNFKKFNDTYGHVAGDDCLRKVARAVAAGASRTEDLAARYGGEEFAVVLPGTDGAGALCVAEGIRKAMLAMRIPHAHSPEGIVTISLGIATAHPDPARMADKLELIRRADTLLYRSKSAGRNRATA
jgi:diguanylate cyclase (GGDEF)-like protein